MPLLTAINMQYPPLATDVAKCKDPINQKNDGLIVQRCA